MREIISAAEKAIQEVRRRERERELERYRPSPKQAAFHQAPHPWRLYLGSNGSGKTTALVAEAVSYALGYRPWDGSEVKTPPVKVALVSQSFTHSNVEDIVPKIEKYLPNSRIVHRGRLANGKVHKYEVDNGSTISLFSYEMDPSAFEGLDFDFVGLNEPPPRSIYVALLRGVSKCKGKIAFAMTPIGSESAWVHDELASVASPDIFTVTAHIDDSFMDQAAKARFLASLTDEEKEARAYGRFPHLVGRVYREFDAGVHSLSSDLVRSYVEDPTIPKGLVIDPHDRKPFAMAWFLVTPKGHTIFYREWPEGNYVSMKSCSFSVAEYAQLIQEIETEPGIVWRLMDPNYGVATRAVTGESIVDRFARHCLYFETNIEDSLANGHLAVKEALLYDRDRPVSDENCPRVYITDECPNLRYAFEHYVWRDRQQDVGVRIREQPAEVGKDFADLIRYVAVSGLGYYDPTAPIFVARRPGFGIQPY